MSSKRKNFKDVLHELADSSSLHGVSKITASRHLPVKILWCLLFLAAFALLVRQMVDLFSTFYSHPIQTSISIKFSPLKLPAVTICNMNAIRLSALSLSPKLNDLAKSFDANETQGGTSVDSNPSTTTPGEINPTPPLAPSFSVSASQISPTPPAESSPNGQPPISPTQSQFPQQSSDFFQVPVMTSSYFDIYDPYNVYNSEFISQSILNDLNENDVTFLKDQLLAERDKWSDRIMKMMSYLKLENETIRQQIGHQSNIIQSVSFSGVVQNVSTTLKRFSDPEYGNCYTLSDPEKFVALRSGPGHGLKITLNVEIDEYVHSFITSPGIKVVLHAPGSLPLPSEEGIILNPATETNVGLKAVSVHRLGQPYGECTEGLEFERKYKMKYSVPACLALCRAKRIMDACKCIPSDSPNIELNTTALPVCNTSKSSVNNVCAKREDIKFDDDHVFCLCENPCSEIIYTTTISSRGWPGDNFLTELMSEVCDDYESLFSMAIPCALLEGDILDKEKYRQNFLQILVYFEDLNYESIMQEPMYEILVYFEDLKYESIMKDPMYEPVRFLSDIGGACGLFLGASVLSFVEFLQLLMEICLYLYHKGKDKANARVKDVMLAQKAISAFKTKPSSTIRRIDVSS